MNARDIIYDELKKLGVNPQDASKHIVAVLLSAGYRILGHDELDAVTLDRILQTVKDIPVRRYADNVGSVEVPPNREEIVAAIRALSTHPENG